MTHRIPTIAAAAALAGCSAGPAQADAASADALTPERAVEANVITSDRDPPITVTMPEEAVYLGAVRWHLYGVADAELHVYVEADEDKVVERFYWVQFEQYLPSKPKAKYTYPEFNPETADIDGYTMHVTPWISQGRERSEKSRKGSDGEAFRKMLSDKGYKMPRGMMMVRLVYLPTPDQRQELMIIYGEDLYDSAMQMNAVFGKGGDAVTRAALTEGLVKRADERIDLKARKGE